MLSLTTTLRNQCPIIPYSVIARCWLDPEGPGSRSLYGASDAQLPVSTGSGSSVALHQEFPRLVHIWTKVSGPANTKGVVGLTSEG